MCHRTYTTYHWCQNFPWSPKVTRVGFSIQRRYQLCLQLISPKQEHVYLCLFITHNLTLYIKSSPACAEGLQESLYVAWQWNIIQATQSQYYEIFFQSWWEKISAEEKHSKEFYLFNSKRQHNTTAGSQIKDKTSAAKTIRILLNWS